MIFGRCLTIRGQIHIDRKTKCQDTSGYYSNSDYTLVVVSDGHGSDECYMSDIGSRIGVQTAMDIICREMNSCSFINRLKNDSEKVLTSIGKTIVSVWKNNVVEYDINNIPDDNLISDKHEIIKKYGATLVVGILTSDCCFGFQVGDGDIFGIDRNGYVYNDMIVKDPRCKNNFTSSLSDYDAEGRIRHFFLRTNVPKCLIVSTDGLSSSFQSLDDCNKIIRLIASKFDVKDAWYHEVADKIGQSSRIGNKDDTSIAIAYSDEIDGYLYETLCTNAIPEWKHGFYPHNMLEIIHDGLYNNSEYISKGLCHDGIFLREGMFIDGLLNNDGLLKYPSIEEEYSIIDIIRGDGTYIFGKFKNNYIEMQPKHKLFEIINGRGSDKRTYKNIISIFDFYIQTTKVKSVNKKKGSSKSE